MAANWPVPCARKNFLGLLSYVSDVASSSSLVFVYSADAGRALNLEWPYGRHFASYNSVLLMSKKFKRSPLYLNIWKLLSTLNLGFKTAVIMCLLSGENSQDTAERD